MLTAADVMTTAVITVTPETAIHEVAKLLCDHHISGVPVIDDEERLLGIVSEGDLIGHARLAGEQRRSWWQTFLSGPMVQAQHYAKSHGRTAGDVMTKDVVTVGRPRRSPTRPARWSNTGSSVSRCCGTGGSSAS
jgi:CBS-domain-containing membrane protein